MAEPATAHAIAITRIFDAPRELVWQAWTQPEQLARWWGKRGWSTPVSSVTLDVRPGGSFRLTSVADDDGREMPLDAVYREVVAPERLEWRDRDGQRVATVTFTDLGDGRTEMVFRTTIRTTDEIRRSAERGLSSAFDRLGEHLKPPPRSHA